MSSKINDTTNLELTRKRLEYALETMSLCPILEDTVLEIMELKEVKQIQNDKPIHSDPSTTYFSLSVQWMQ